MTDTLLSIMFSFMIFLLRCINTRWSTCAILCTLLFRVYLLFQNENKNIVTREDANRADRDRRRSEYQSRDENNLAGVL